MNGRLSLGDVVGDDIRHEGRHAARYMVGHVAAHADRLGHVSWRHVGSTRGSTNGTKCGNDGRRL